jgi:hypothetical protein
MDYLDCKFAIKAFVLICKMHKTLALRLAAVLTALHGFPQSIQTNIRVVYYNRPQAFHSTSFPFHLSQIILPYDAAVPKQIK